jgi:hypothetical protein
LREENRLLKQQLRGKRLRLTDDDRRRLSAKGILLGRKLLAQVATIVTPETILAWHRKLVGKTMTAGRRSPGRPRSSRDLAALVVKMAKDNPSWGYDRLEGALKNLGHVIAPTTIRNILHRRGLDPAPFTSWSQVFGELRDVWFAPFAPFQPTAITSAVTADPGWAGHACACHSPPRASNSGAKRRRDP